MVLVFLLLTPLLLATVARFHDGVTTPGGGG